MPNKKKKGKFRNTQALAQGLYTYGVGSKALGLGAGVAATVLGAKNPKAISKAVEKGANLSAKSANLAGKQLARDVLAGEAKGGIRGIGKALARGVINEHSTNHPDWYTNYKAAELINLNFGLRKDIPIMPSSYAVTNEGTTFSFNDQVNPVARLDVQLTTPAEVQTPNAKPNELAVIQLSKGWSQGINYIFSALRAANSSVAPYSITALAQYMQNVRLLHALYCEIRRAYAMVWNYDIYDARLPKVYFKAVRLDWESFKANAANLRVFGNELGVAIARLLPARFPYIDRTRWMFSNFFADSDDAKFSSYVFTINGRQQFYNESDGKINHIFDTVNKSYTYEEYISEVNKVRNAILTNGVTANIASEFFKAFGSEMIYPAEIWPESMEVPIIYDEAALTQIQNSLILPDRFSNSNTTTEQTTYGIMNSYVGTYSPDNEVQWRVYNSWVINFYKDKATPGEMLSATRLGFVDAKITGGIGGNAQFIPLGTEIVWQLDVLDPGDGDADDFTLGSISTFETLIAAPPTSAEWDASTISTIKSIQCWSQMDYAPRVVLSYFGMIAGSANDAATYATLFDFNNYAIYDSYENKVSNASVAMQSLLYVPVIVKQANWTAIDVND